MKQSFGLRKNPCLECFECCKNISFSLKLEGPLYLYKQFAEVRGIEVAKIVDDKIYFLIPYPCPHLTRVGCRIYSERPEVCRIYDGRRDNAIKDRCKLSTEVITT